MPDSEWLKNLAGATFAGGRWQAADPEAVAKLTESRVAMAMARLEDEATAATEVYNDHARGRRPIRLLRVKDGFAMLCGAAQVTLVPVQGGLSATLTVNAGFKRRTQPLMQLAAHVDAFGAVAWNVGGQMLVSEDLIVQRLFEELARAAQT
jgi:hypothetical protein